MLRKLQDQDTCWGPRYLWVNFHFATHSLCGFRQLRSLYRKYRLWNLTLWLKRVACHETFYLWLYYIAVLETLPSTREVRSVTFAAFLLPAGKFSPSLSNFSRKQRPPFLDFALSQENSKKERYLSLFCTFHPVNITLEIGHTSLTNVWGNACSNDISGKYFGAVLLLSCLL